MEFKDIEKHINNFGKNHLSYWGCALAGEVGELCNLIKKHERDGAFSRQRYAEELADVFIYTSLTARVLSVDLEAAIIEKLAVVKQRRDAAPPNATTGENVVPDAKDIELARLRAIVENGMLGEKCKTCVQTRSYCAAHGTYIDCYKPEHPAAPRPDDAAYEDYARDVRRELDEYNDSISPDPYDIIDEDDIDIGQVKRREGGQ